MRVVAVIQARLGSTRLPGKVLKDLAGQSMLARVVERVQLAPQIDEIVVATTTNPVDLAVVAESKRLGVATFRGAEEDVLDRFYQSSRLWRADAVVRITADCPLIDPAEIGRVIGAFLAEIPDYASNCLVRTLPRGLDTEVMTASALARAWREASERYQRVHVTPYLYQNPDLFKLLSVESETDESHLRWTVDTAEDLAFVRAVYQQLEDPRSFSWRDVLAILNRAPELRAINAKVRQKELREA